MRVYGCHPCRLAEKGVTEEEFAEFLALFEIMEEQGAEAKAGWLPLLMFG